MMTIEIKLALLAFCVLLFFAIGMIVGYVIGYEQEKRDRMNCVSKKELIDNAKELRYRSAKEITETIEKMGEQK